jgi:hypothetical protein
MTEQQPQATPPRESRAPLGRAPRAPLAAALVGVACVALVAGFVLAGGLAGSAPAVGAGAPELPVVAPIDAPAPAFVDVGWAAPGARAPIADDNRGNGNGNGFGRAVRDGRISITKIDGEKLSLVTIDGWTRTVDATGAKITRAGDAITVADLRVGDEITFRQKRAADGSYEIVAIRVLLPKVSGTIGDVGSSGFVLTARDGTKTTVKVTATTTYRLGKSKADQAALVAGMQAMATGTRNTDGSVTATSVVIAPSMVAGTVTATSASTITVKDRTGDTVTVKVDQATTYRVPGVKEPTAADVKVDMWIIATGAKGADGSIAASSVMAAPAGRGGRWGDWKPFRGQGGGNKASPAPTKPPTSEG